MAKRDFRDVRAVLIESNSMLRGDLRTALVDKGIPDPIICKGTDAFLDVAGKEVLDLVVCESTPPGGGFPAAIQRIRHNQAGGNPFVVVIATLHDASMNRVQAVLDGGVDDLLLKPTPVKRIVDRIDHLVKDRLPFVVSNGYVGPTRRGTSRTSDDKGAMIEVPNTLRSKVVDKADSDTLRRMINEAIGELEEKVAQQPLSSIDRLIERAQTYADGSKADGAAPAADESRLRRDFAALTTLSLDMSRRYRGSAFDHIADLAAALATLARRIAEQNPKALQQSDLDLLSSMGEAIRGSIAAETKSAATVREIAAEVERFAGTAKPGGAKTKH